MSVPLSAFEHRVLEAFLSGDDLRLQTLRQQLALCSVSARRNTGVSSFTDLDVPADAARMSPLAITMGDLDLQIEGLHEGATAMLFVRAGALARLECVTNAGAWPDDPKVTGIGYLRYERAASGAYQLIPVAQRDGETLALQLAGHKSSIPDPALQSGAVAALPQGAVLQQPVIDMAALSARITET